MINNIIGFTAGLLSVLLFLPQIIHIIKRKSAKDISYIYLFILSISSILWIIWGVLENEMPIILCDSIILFLVFCMLIIKIYYDYYYKLNIDV